jgi:hypothetical protein
VVSTSQVGVCVRLLLSTTKNRSLEWSITPWSASELYRPSDRRMSVKLVPTFADPVVSATDPHGRILGFLDGSRYYFFQIAPQLYSRGWVDPVLDPLLPRKSGNAGNRTRDLWICSHWPLDHLGVTWSCHKLHLTKIRQTLNQAPAQVTGSARFESRAIGYRT